MLEDGTQDMPSGITLSTSMKRAMLIASCAAACTVRSGCDTGSARQEIDGMTIAVETRAIKKLDVGFLGAPHVGGILWPEFDGYGIELRISVDDRPPFSVAAPASDRDASPNEEELQAVAASVSFAVAPDRQHLAFRRETRDGWTVVHLLPQGVPFRSDHSDVGGVGDEPLPWSDLPSPQTLALEAIERGRPELTLAAVRDQSAAQPWNDALLERWPTEDAIHETLVERLENHPPTDEEFVSRAGTKALAEIRRNGKSIRRAVDLLLALGDADRIAQMDERLLGALPDPEARRILARRVARISTLGRDHPPSDELKDRARVELEALSKDRK